jgi:ABC-type transport system involved in cytochrome c biogenesis permease subunit
MGAESRRLITTWLALVCLMAVAGLASGLGGSGAPGLLALAVLSVATIAKARLVLARYLRLATVPAVLSGFTIGIAAIVILVTMAVASGIEMRRPSPVCGHGTPCGRN